MFKLPEISSIDFSKLDISALRNFELPKSVDYSKFAAAIRDAAFVTVGLGVVAVEQAQGLRRQLVAAISARFGASKTNVDKLLATVEARMTKVDERVNAVEARLENAVGKIEGVLPEQAHALLGQARDFSRVARKQVRGLIRPAA